MSTKSILNPMNRVAILFAFLLLSFSPANVWAEGENATQVNSSQETTVEPSSDEVAQASTYAELTPEEQAKQDAEVQAKAKRSMILNYTFMAVGLIVVVSIAFLTSSKKKAKTDGSIEDQGDGQHHPHSYQHRMDPYFRNKLHRAKR